MRHLLCILILIITDSVGAQSKNVCVPIVVNDSLFNVNTVSYHSYAERNGSFSKSRNDGNIVNIDSVFKIKNGCLQFGLMFSKASVQSHQFTFVTDNKLKSDSGKKYYHLKIIVNKDNETAAIDARVFNLNLSCFDSLNMAPLYMKINNIPQLIKLNE